MRSFGILLLVCGVVGFVYCTNRLGILDPVPEGLSVGQSLEYEAGKVEVGRYACACGALVGLLLLMFPKGR